MFGEVGSTASAGSFWPFRAATFGGLPTLTRAPVPAWGGGAAAWAAGTTAASAHTMLPAAGSTRSRHFLRTFIETPWRSANRSRRSSLTANGDAQAKGRPRSKTRGPQNWDTEVPGSAGSGDPLVRATKSHAPVKNAQGYYAVTSQAKAATMNDRITAS